MNKKYLCLALSAVSLVSQAEVRKIVTNNGKVVYTNVAAAASTARPMPDVLPADVIGAVSNIIGVAQLVGRSSEFCGSVFPASQKKFSASAYHWQRRNAAVVSHKDRVMSHGDQVLVAAALNSDALRKTEAMLRPVIKGSAAEQGRWCAQAFADVDRGRLDLAGRASIVPLMRIAP
ncbi:hypothetical protein KY495_10060 [Massilia sp. PAMC28688]|uniref:hypothetical protein n=1 Tax=Massilia sp. PAMC28688 TaxID=2861283 RepID=UPI001C63A15A|nr:hypothetical protein [Massilia sp. PAMC28688]QYF95460.1 hypothetical protein KY495_10060 [Massilia sp. PAMC28688]